MRVARKSWKTYALGAAALAALLAATACEPGDLNSGTGTTPSATPSATATTKPGGGGVGTAGGSGSADSGASATAATTATTAACTEADIAIATTLYAHDSVRHLLLTATNTGDKECTLYRYPVVGFGSGHEGPIGPMESEMKDAAIAPGQKAYAGMLLFRTGAPTDAVETMTVSLQGRVSNADPDSGPIEVPLPDDTSFLNIDDNPLVSYWNVSREKAEGYMFKAAGGN
jgi:hypothetical protein